METRPRLGLYRQSKVRRGAECHDITPIAGILRIRNPPVSHGEIRI
jgi:hypothetical protein